MSGVYAGNPRGSKEFLRLCPKRAAGTFLFPKITSLKKAIFWPDEWESPHSACWTWLCTWPDWSLEMMARPGAVWEGWRMTIPVSASSVME